MGEKKTKMILMDVGELLVFSHVARVKSSPLSAHCET